MSLFNFFKKPAVQIKVHFAVDFNWNNSRFYFDYYSLPNAKRLGLEVKTQERWIWQEEWSASSLENVRFNFNPQLCLEVVYQDELSTPKSVAIYNLRNDTTVERPHLRFRFQDIFRIPGDKAWEDPDFGGKGISPEFQIEPNGVFQIENGKVNYNKGVFSLPSKKLASNYSDLVRKKKSLASYREFLHGQYPKDSVPGCAFQGYIHIDSPDSEIGTIFGTSKEKFENGPNGGFASPNGAIAIFLSTEE